MPKGDGSIQYDYQAMYQAFDDMKSTNKDIESRTSETHDSTVQVLAASDGATREGYEAKWTQLKAELTDLNDMMGVKANTMDQLFNDMKRLDGNIAAGF